MTRGDADGRDDRFLDGRTVVTTRRPSGTHDVLRYASHALLGLIPRNTTAGILTGPLRGSRWIVGSSTHNCWIGTFERRKLELFATALRQGDVVYDLGAHVGLYSLLAASRVGSTGHVYAFEPLPRNLGYLARHLTLNEVNNCSVVDVAVSAHSGRAIFDKSIHPAMGHLGANGGPELEVQTAALDDLVASRTVRAPSVIKCDIEGAEYAALNGAATVLSMHRPIIFLATHGPRVHASCCDLLDNLGFDLYSLDGLSLSRSTEIVALPR